jgi:hypothetical protein
MKKSNTLPKVDAKTYSINPALAGKKYILTEESQQLRAKLAALANKIVTQ